MLNEESYLDEEVSAIKELSERFGINESLAVDCVASRTSKQIETVLVFLRRYGHMIEVK
jgi:hypothetical protein